MVSLSPMGTSVALGFLGGVPQTGVCPDAHMIISVDGQGALDHRARRSRTLDGGVALLCLLVFWLPIVGEPTWRRYVQVGLMVFVLAGSLGRSRYPVPALSIVALSTLGGVVLGVSSDPFIAAAWSLYAVARNRGGARSLRVLSIVFGVAIVTVTLVGSVAIAAAVRYVLLSLVVVAGAWTLGSVTRRERLESEHVAYAEREGAVVAERLRLARELHDIVSHSLSTIAIISAIGRRNDTTDVDSLRTKLAEIELLSGSALTDMQTAFGAIRDQTEGVERSPQPGLSELNTLVERAERAGTSTTLTVRVIEPLAASLELAVYRITQEGLTNAMRHAPRARCAVSVNGTVDGVRVAITNEASSNEPPARDGRVTKGGFGLIGLRERVELMGGTFAAAPRVGGGFSIRASIPNPRHTKIVDD